MTNAIASGLGSTWGLAEEDTVGTWVTPTRWYPQADDKVVGDKKTAQSEALHGGLFELGQRRRITAFAAAGQVDLDVTDTQLGLLLKHMIGSSPVVTQLGETTAYQQVHTDGDLLGLSLSLQSGRPYTDGTVVPFAYNGAKITEWELSVEVGGLAKLGLTFDAMDEVLTTTYGAASYVAANVLNAVDAVVLLGGTVSTTDGVTTVTDGAEPVGTVKSISIKGSNSLATDRQTLGSLTKREQLANAFRKYTGEFVVEWATQADMYTAYRDDSATALQLNITGDVIEGDYSAGLNVLCPMIKINGAPPTVDGPAFLSSTASFDILDDGAGDPRIQFIYTSTDQEP